MAKKKKPEPQSIMDKLYVPFEAHDVEWRVGATNKDKSKGLALAYVTSRAVYRRLNEVLGIDGWSDNVDFVSVNVGGTTIDAAKCTLTIHLPDRTISRTGFGALSSVEIAKTPTDRGNSVKGGESDAVKRAAVKFGIGAYLYALPSIWVALKSGKYIERSEMGRLHKAAAAAHAAFMDGIEVVIEDMSPPPDGAHNIVDPLEERTRHEPARSESKGGQHASPSAHPSPWRQFYNHVQEGLKAHMELKELQDLIAWLKEFGYPAPTNEIEAGVLNNQIIFVQDVDKWSRAFHKLGNAAYGKSWDEQRGIMSEEMGVDSSTKYTAAMRIFALRRVSLIAELIDSIESFVPTGGKESFVAKMLAKYGEGAVSIDSLTIEQLQAETALFKEG